MADVQFDVLKAHLENLKSLNDINETLVKIKGNIEDVIGTDYKEGRLDKLEEQVKELMQIKWKVVGFLIALVLLMEGAHAGVAKLVEVIK